MKYELESTEILLPIPYYGSGKDNGFLLSLSALWRD